MQHASIFSGIGGFDLAAEWMGWDNVLHCEIDPFCRVVLQNYWPYATSIENILDWPDIAVRVDILTGGFPCQAFSVAGKRAGTADPRYLWPAMLATVKRLQPAYVVAENVMGLISWNQGLVCEQVHLDLEAEGFDVWAFVLPAAGVGAPHLRNRIWFCGYNPAFDLGCRTSSTARAAVHDPAADPAHTLRQGLEGTPSPRKNGPTRRPGWRVEVPVWDHWPTESPVCQRDDGLPGRLAGITFPAWRKQGITAMGNAIVPQVALRIFRAIAAHRTAILLAAS